MPKLAIDGIGEVAYEPEQNYSAFMFKYDARAFSGVPKGRFVEALSARKPLASPAVKCYWGTKQTWTRSRTPSRRYKRTPMN